MHRLAFVALAICACGGGRGRARSETPSGRAPELATVAPGCDGATLRAFDPGLPGREVVAVDERREPDAPLTREHTRGCDAAEDDDTCIARARREVLAADPDATIGDATIAVGSSPGPRLVPEERRRIVPAVDSRVTRETNRHAVVSYEVPVPAPARTQWEATLRWPLPPDVPAALEHLQREVERAQLVIARYEVGLDGISAAVACP